MKNPKSLWNAINQKLRQNSKRNKNINYIIDNSVKITDSTLMAQHVNKFFCEIGKKISDRIVTPRNEEIKLPPMNRKSIFITRTNHIEILNITNNIEIKNGGIDYINTKTLKTLSVHIVNQLVHICNQCIDKATWPDALKIAEVIPTHKSNEKHIPTNYRPISLISNIAKIFEKIIHNRITNFINSCDLLTKNQYGFRKNRSIKEALFQLSNMIYKNIDTSTPIAITFLDLVKAFDTIDHQILLDKLYNYEIRGSAYNLLKNYLTNRQQRVKLNNKTSKFESVTMGVSDRVLYWDRYYFYCTSTIYY